MKQALSWIALTAGLGMLGYSALLLFRIAIVMEPFGGIAALISRSFFEANPRLAVMPILGLVLAAAGLLGLRRERR